MTKEVEDIILNKAYFELTPDELEQVGPLAQTQEEFDQLKWFLTETGEAVTEAQVKPSADLRKNVMAHLTASKKKKGFWLNSVGVFMLPEGKKIHQMPAFQLGIAAVLTIGLLFVFNRGVETPTLAINDTAVQESNEMVLEKTEGNVENDSFNVLNNMQEPVMTPPVMTDELEAFAEKDEEYKTVSEPAEIIEMDLAEEEVPIPVMDFDMEIMEDDEEVADLIEMEEEEMGRVVATSKNEQQTITSEDLSSGKKRDKEVKAIERADETYFSRTETEKVVVVDSLAVNANADVNADIVTTFNMTDDATVTQSKSFELSTQATTASVPALADQDVQLGEVEVAPAEWIVPKALHIDQTKELKSLFYIEK